MCLLFVCIFVRLLRVVGVERCVGAFQIRVIMIIDMMMMMIIIIIIIIIIMLLIF